MIKVTLGTKVPNANRTGALITGPDGLQAGLMTVLKAEDYIYVYSNAEPENFVVGRARLSDAFDATKYEFLKKAGNWGSIMYSHYFGNTCSLQARMGTYRNFYTSDTLYGPWNGRYILAINIGYGINVHPQFSPGGDHRIWNVSSGT
ncbi:hypothetical protein IFR04_001457 [Cadophora malorum]|uniref:Uncharacterized protein n=1 Tax=Cadophora malorum TaxID=108018 RepID=A0A8H7WIB2_9HELO|nr:hypothetical protein IFR04_001457 [Cadophora malorum]